MSNAESTRFWAKVNKTDLCWFWTACVGTHGYGQVQFGGTQHTAHRVAWILTHGPIADGLHLDHLCRNKLCVNPAHLEPVTPSENARRAAVAVRLHCPHGHVLDGVNRRGGRWCKTCNRERQRRLGSRLTTRQEQALCMLAEAARNGHNPHGVVMATRWGSGETTAVLDGQPWIHYRTAYALRDRGLVRIEDPEDIYLAEDAA